MKTILKWTKGKLLQGEPHIRVGGISIDSRTILPGELFLALPGKNFDGHDFARAALEKGAGGLILERELPRLPPVGDKRALIQVESSEKALTGLARGYRANLQLRIIAITGSNGKTTAKNLVGQLLSTKLKTIVAPASYNNWIGVSLTVLQIEKDHRVAVFELGMNRRGEIRELGQICRPQIGVILNVGPAHIGFLGGLEEIARTKAELLETLEGERVAVLNYDDERVRRMSELAPGPVISFAIKAPAQIRASNLAFSREGIEFDLSLFSRTYHMQSPLLGLHNLYNLLAAIAVAHHFKLPPPKMQAAVRKAALPPMRWEIVQIKGVTVINDAYNANPASMRAALATWLQMPVEGRRILVSGDMKELGDFAEEEHRSWGEEVGRAGLGYLVFVGPLSRLAARGALKKGFPRQRVFITESRKEAAEFLKETIASGDSVLLKGSRIMALEEIEEMLKEKVGSDGGSSVQ